MRFAEGSNVVVLDPDVADLFTDSESVNDALRTLAGIAVSNPRKLRVDCNDGLSSQCSEPAFGRTLIANAVNGNRPRARHERPGTSAQGIDYLPASDRRSGQAPPRFTLGP